MTLAPPSGAPPPARARTEGGRELELEPLAREVAKRYGAEHPDEAAERGPAWLDWCVHDNQYLLSWAVLATSGFVDLHDKLAWLARVLEARGLPPERLARDLELAADVVGERVEAQDAEAIGAELRGGAELLRSRKSFL